MATLALSVAGRAIGAAVAGPLGGTIGRAVGAIAGSFIDRALIGSSGQERAGNALTGSALKISSSTEGDDIPRVYGRARVAGQLFWATHLRKKKIKAGSTGKGLGTGSSTSGQSFEYFGNFALALCEGPITGIGRVWADSDDSFDISKYTHRVYLGTETQTADSLMVAKEGAGNTPAYRGLAYIVFEEMPLKKFGNRIPQLHFEVFRAVDTLESDIRAITMIPAAGEFAYEPDTVTRQIGTGRYAPENRQTLLADSNIMASLDQLEATMPNCTRVALFTAWFGDDQRCGNCTIRPKVDLASKTTTPYSWAAAGLTRGSAQVVSTYLGEPAYGGSPADKSVINAISEMTSRGLAVTLTPFLLMDIPAGNSLPDPYQAGMPAGQAVYPWRGRITCAPAPGVSGSPDKTAAAGTQVSAFVGTVAASHFSVTPGNVTYTGPAEWSYSRFILHHAALAAAAGGVDAFVIGSEMRGLTWVRDSASTYPFVTALKNLAAQVAILLPSAKLTYAADWSEWFGHQPTDGSNDVYFHLDPLWSDANIDAIGIDNYWPLSDWRDGTAHLDYVAGWRDPRDIAYLRANIEGGEGYSWYYTGTAARDAQTRTTITDGAYSKPWVFRFKDIKNWWLNQHYNRPGGVESATPTAWVPESKPFWFMELGCPAADRGSNQPNVFYDPKSSESFLPYYSRGSRDDGQQRAYLKAMIGWYNPSAPDFVNAQNPLSSVYTGRMVDHMRIYVYTWDARPFPAFPELDTVWSDAANWELGHWLTGRAGDAPLGAAVAKLLDDAGFADYDAKELNGQLQGYLIERIGSARDALQPLELAFFFDSVESGGKIVFRHRGLADPVKTFALGDLVETRAGEPRALIRRGQETELPRAVKLTYVAAEKDFQQGSVEARRLAMESSRVSQANLPLIITYEQALRIAHVWLHEAWASRETLTAVLAPSALAVEPTDLITVTAGGMTLDYRVISASVGQALEVRAASIGRQVYSGVAGGKRSGEGLEPPLYGPVVAAFMDLPLITGFETPHAGRIAAYASPWSGAAFYRSPATSGYELNALLEAQATIGETEFAFYSGPTGRWDYGNKLRVKLYEGALASAADILVLGGANLMAIENADGEWELFQFATAQLISTGVYDLSKLLRGQFGTERAMRNPVAVGARVVLIDADVGEAAMTVDERLLPFSWKYGPAARDLADASYQTVTRSFSGLGLRPYSPVHVKGARNAGNDLTISWVRRDRIGADSWDQADVPMSEAVESYEVNVMSGSSVVRTLTSSTPSVTYTAAQQTTDFGAPQSSVTVRVHQISAVFGRGAYRQATV